MKLSSAIENYVALKRSLGAVFSVDAGILRSFSRALGDVCLEAITAEYATLFKLPTTELFQLSRDRYTNVLSTEIHAQADVARRLNFEADWIWS